MGYKFKIITYKGSSKSILGPEKEPMLNGPSKSKKEDTKPKQCGKKSNVKSLTKIFSKAFILNQFTVLDSKLNRGNANCPFNLVKQIHNW